jgi:uncharacterized phage protein (TIGR01671 family)|nr:MAG TPA: YopX protein [Caudoviricetes sp.]
MREIKFRAWDWIEKQMCPVIVADFQGSQSKLFCRFPKSGTQGIIDTDHLMQYIGAKDKNGVEIYEGDVIRGKRKVNYVIRWSDAKCGFVADAADAVDLCKMFPALNQGTTVYYEVIGNIYANPEMVRNEADS